MVKELPKYQSIINDDGKQQLGGRYPLQIYLIGHQTTFSSQTLTAIEKAY